MIIIDYYNIAMPSLIESRLSDETIARIKVLNSLGTVISKHKRNYDKPIVIACDDIKSWRKDFFSNYKSHRKKDREKQDVDWKFVYNMLDKIREELRDNFPYKVIHVENCEADDIISFIVQKYHPAGDILIVSSDKDFRQLQMYPGVSQYTPRSHSFVKESSPSEFLKEEIIRGQAKDGIPSILSPDNVFVDNIRQSPIFSKNVDVWLNQKPEEFCNEEMLSNYKRNETLIDLHCTPDKYKAQISSAYDDKIIGSKNTILNYFMKYKLSPLIDILEEF